MMPDVLKRPDCARLGLNGQPIDLLRPDATDVDFAEIAQVLAQVNAYAGNALKPVSIAQHVLIACDAAPPELMPWVLLRHAHKARLGDPTPETITALSVLAGALRLGGDSALRDAWAHLTELHDIAIHSAAHLDMPNAAQRRAMLDIDRITEATIMRDFRAKPRKGRGAGDTAKPMSRVYRLRSVFDVADDLLARFQVYLPSLRAVSRRSVHS